MYGLFVETGPFYVDSDIKLQPRNYTWATNYNVLYIDNPVGTGTRIYNLIIGLLVHFRCGN